MPPSPPRLLRSLPVDVALLSRRADVVPKLVLLLVLVLVAAPTSWAGERGARSSLSDQANDEEDSPRSAIRPASGPQTRREMRPLRVARSSREEPAAEDGPDADPATDREQASSAIPLPPPRDAPKSSASRRATPTPARALVTVASSLAIVTGLLVLAVWLARKTMPRSALPLPPDVVQVLGRVSLGHRQQATLIRVGAKLVLVAVSQHGAEALTEITDPDEVERLSGICESERPGSASATFRELLGELAEPTQRDTREARGTVD